VLGHTGSTGKQYLKAVKGFDDAPVQRFAKPVYDFEETEWEPRPAARG